MGMIDTNLEVIREMSAKVSPLHDLQLLEIAISSSSQGFVVWDSQQKLVACSNKCPDFWYEPTDILKPGMPMVELLHHIADKGGFGPGDPDKLVRGELLRILKAGPDSEDEFKMLDGRVIHVQRNSMQDGGHASTYTDITERRKLEFQLNEAIKAIPEGFALYDADDRLVICNNSYRAMYAGLNLQIVPGTRYEEIIRQAVESGLIPDAMGCAEDWLVERLEKHRQPLEPFEQRRADGRWLKINESKTEEGGVVGVFTDISKMKSHEAQLGEMVDSLAEARDQAMQGAQAKSQFLANMSHELRTPLNAIIGITEMLKEEAIELSLGDMIEPLDRVYGAGTHLLTLINSILDISKLDFHHEEFDLGVMIHDTAASARPLAEKNGNELIVRCPDSIGQMHADPTRVRQILSNLLSNACKFTEQGRVSLEVTRSAKNGKGWVTFKVSDTGIGMTPEQVSKLFQEFSQADSSTTRKYEGTGLGLVISKQLCAAMGGEISVTSTLGIGTTFVTLLPVQVDDRLATTVQTPAAQIEAAKVYRTMPDAAPGSPGRVLVVDDDITSRDLMRRFLAKEGFDVITAKDGEEGLALARQIDPSVITLDVLLPGMDGWSVLHQLKADPKLAGIPVLMLTIVDDKNKGFTLGASDYVTKPIKRERLQALLGKYKSSDRPARIMVVEDDEVVRQNLARMLKAEGCQVFEAENGRVALDLLEEVEPSLILLDLIMPELDGFEFLTELRGMRLRRNIPIVVVTAADLSVADRSRLTGSVERILQKESYSRDELLKEVRDLVAGYVTGASSTDFFRDNG